MTTKEVMRSRGMRLIVSGASLSLFAYLLVTHLFVSQTNIDQDETPSLTPIKRSILPKRLRVRTSPPPSLDRLRIEAGLPDTSDLLPSSTLVRAYDEAFNSLTDYSKSLLTTRAITGVPGTGITTDLERAQLQQELDEANGSGEWIRDEEGGRSGAGLTVHKHSGVLASCDKVFYNKGGKTSNDGGWHVRESLKYRWKPTKRPESASPLSRVELCALLAHKSLLLVGDVPQYTLHDLILDFTSLQPQSCYGDLYCKEHALCGDILRHKSHSAIENYETDERVYHSLPPPPISPITPPLPFPLDKGGSKGPSYGTMLRYRRSDGLRASQQYTEPVYIHPKTGVREVNQPWIADARRSDVVVLSKGPLPLPEPGNDRAWDVEFDFSRSIPALEKAALLVKAVERLTREVWLPEVLDTLRVLRGKGTPDDILIVWRGGWRMQADCAASALADEEPAEGRNSPGDGPPPHASSPSLATILFRPSSSSSDRQLRDIHSVFFNLQTVLQNHLLRRLILPHFGVPYLDLETPLSVWRSGMVGSSVAPPFGTLIDQTGEHHGTSVGLRSSASGDCLRYCIPSPGMGVEQAFLGGLQRIFERGWVGLGLEGEREKRDRSTEWVGDDFRNLKEREAERAA